MTKRNRKIKDYQSNKLKIIILVEVVDFLLQCEEKIVPKSYNAEYSTVLMFNKKVFEYTRKDFIF